MKAVTRRQDEGSGDCSSTCQIRSTIVYKSAGPYFTNSRVDGGVGVGAPAPTAQGDRDEFEVVVHE